MSRAIYIRPDHESEISRLRAKIKRVEALAALWESQGHHAQWRASTLRDAIAGRPNKWLPNGGV